MGPHRLLVVVRLGQLGRRGRRKVLLRGRVLVGRDGGGHGACLATAVVELLQDRNGRSKGWRSRSSDQVVKGRPCEFGNGHCSQPHLRELRPATMRGLHTPLTTRTDATASGLDSAPPPLRFVFVYSSTPVTHHGRGTDFGVRRDGRWVSSIVRVGLTSRPPLVYADQVCPQIGTFCDLTPGCQHSAQAVS